MEIKTKTKIKSVLSGKRIAEAMDKYFSKPSQRTLYKTEYHAAGGIKSKTPALEPCEFPTFEGFAAKLGISLEALLEKEKRSSAVAKACERARQSQKRIIVTNALAGDYNSSFSQFMLINRFGGEFKAKPAEQGASGFDVSVVYGKE